MESICIVRTKKYQITIKIIYLIILYTCVLIFPLSAILFQWDGTEGQLGNLDIWNDGVSDTIFPSDNRLMDGYVGRFVYQGEANKIITITSGGLTPSMGASPEYFYYTKIDNLTYWRRVNFVVTMKPLLHNDSEGAVIGSVNTVLETQGSTITIPIGAGSEQVSNPTVTGGYNALGQWGFTTAHIYKYPYKYIWIDMAVVRTASTSISNANLGQGSYQLFINVTGQGISTAFSLSGYTKKKNAPIPLQEDTYTFSVERLGFDSLIFPILVTKDSASHSCPVGIVRFNSVDTHARVFFASDLAGTSADYRFTSGMKSFGYSLLYVPIIPSLGTITEITSPNITFNTEQRTVYSPLFPNTSQQQYVLTGELRIFVSPDLKYNIPPSGKYTSVVYCFVMAD
jgi:hypothetical protein